MPDTDPRVDSVNEHMRLENAHDFGGCIAEFGRPRYEVVADGELFDGAERVDDFLSENRHAFPDFKFEPTRVSPTTDAVVVEGRFKGTHLGTWRGLLPTGRKVDFAMCLIFEFEGDTMVNERIYFDIGTPLRQLGVEFDPNSARGKLVALLTHPVTITRAVLRNAWLVITHRKR
jgi:predicted ester cyclase